MMHLRLVTWAPTKWWKAVGADDETADPRRGDLARVEPRQWLPSHATERTA